MSPKTAAFRPMFSGTDGRCAEAQSIYPSCSSSRVVPVGDTPTPREVEGGSPDYAGDEVSGRRGKISSRLLQAGTTARGSW